MISTKLTLCTEVKAKAYQPPPIGEIGIAAEE